MTSRYLELTALNKVDQIFVPSKQTQAVSRGQARRSGMRKSPFHSVTRSLQIDNAAAAPSTRSSPRRPTAKPHTRLRGLTARNRARLYQNTPERVPQNQAQSPPGPPRQKPGTLPRNLSCHSLHCCKTIIRKRFEDPTTNSASCVKYISNHSRSTDSGMKLMAISPNWSRSIIRQCKVARKPT